MQKVFVLVFVLFLGIATHAQEEDYKLVKYYFVELIKNSDRPEIDSVKIREIQSAHMQNMRDMASNGELVCAGPFGDEEGGGIWILSVDSYNEAESLCKMDPAVMNERITYKIRPWWTSENTFTLEKN